MVVDDEIDRKLFAYDMQVTTTYKKQLKCFCLQTAQN